MREIHVEAVTQAVHDLCIEANTCLRDDHVAALERGLAEEESPLGREVLRQLLENAMVACEECVAFCQDTGYAVLFVELGQDVHVVGGGLGEAIDAGVRQGYEQGYLRKSIVESPISSLSRSGSARKASSATWKFTCS